MSFPKYEKYFNSESEWLRDLPQGWQKTSLKRVVEQNRQITYGIVQAGPNVEDGVPYIRPADMSDENGIEFYGDILRTSQEIADSYRRSTIRTGDLVCSIGPSFGKVMVTPDYLDGANLTQGTARVAIAKEHSTRFYFWVLRSLPSVCQWESSVGGATFRALNLGPLAKTEVPLPPLPEQHAIAAFLDRETAKIDALVAEQRRLVELLKEKRQAVISHAVTKGLDPHAPLKPSGIPWLGDVPKHWTLNRLKHISPFMSVGIVVNPTNYISDDASDLPFIYGGDIREGVIDWENSRRISPESSMIQNKTRLRAGDLLTVRVGAPGVTAVVSVECEGGNCASVMLVRQGDFNSHWLCYLMNTRVIRFQVEVVEYGAAQKQFNIAHAVNFWAPVPSRREQDKIVAFLDRQVNDLDGLQCEAERAITLLQERRTALISAAVTGKIDVRQLALQEAAA